MTPSKFNIVDTQTGVELTFDSSKKEVSATYSPPSDNYTVRTTLDVPEGSVPHQRLTELCSEAEKDPTDRGELS